MNRTEGGSPRDARSVVDENRRAWELTAEKYAEQVDAHVEMLERGEAALDPEELEHLGDLSSCSRAIHLCCSHGLDALSLLQLGADEVVGVDISVRMLEQARAKAERLAVPARWIRSDILELLDGHPELAGTFDLVYTGKGALPWMSDIERWAGVVEGLLRPGGTLFVFEGHPLDVLWTFGDESYRLRPGADYFARGPVVTEGFPRTAVERRWTPRGASGGTSEPPVVREFQWTVGEVVTAVAGAGLRVDVLEEYPRPYWNRFSDMDPDSISRLPHTFALRAHKSPEGVGEGPTP